MLDKIQLYMEERMLCLELWRDLEREEELVENDVMIWNRLVLNIHYLTKGARQNVMITYTCSGPLWTA